MEDHASPAGSWQLVPVNNLKCICKDLEHKHRVVDETQSTAASDIKAYDVPLAMGGFTEVTGAIRFGRKLTWRDPGRFPHEMQDLFW